MKNNTPLTYLGTILLACILTACGAASSGSTDLDRFGNNDSDPIDTSEPQQTNAARGLSFNYSDEPIKATSYFSDDSYYDLYEATSVELSFTLNTSESNSYRARIRETGTSVESFETSEFDYDSLFSVEGGENVVTLYLKSPANLPLGIHRSSILVDICEDTYCENIAIDGAVEVELIYNTLSRVKGIEDANVSKQTVLEHNVIDVEYSSSLDAMVSISDDPINALYILNLSNNEEQTIALNKAPLALAFDDINQTAAIGHDALISAVNFSAENSTPTLSEIAVNMKVYDIAIKGDYVFLTPTGENLSGDQSSVVQIKLNNGSKTMFGQIGYSTFDASDSKLSVFQYLDTLVVSGSYTIGLIDYQGTEDQTFKTYNNYCDTIWPLNGGERYLTACGDIYSFTRTADEWGGLGSLEEAYSGSIQTVLNSDYSYNKSVVQFVDYPPLNQFTVVEYLDPDYGHYDWSQSSNNNSVISQHSRDYLTKKSSYTLPHIEIEDEYYRQIAEHVFYDNDSFLNVVSIAQQPDSDKAAFVLNRIEK